MNAIYRLTGFSSAAELVIIDSGVDQPEHLLQGLKPNTEVRLLDSKEDGVIQITQILQEVRARRVHIVSHGSPGCLYLGNTQLNLNTLKRYQEQVKTWRVPLLLYGCRVAATETGQRFVQQLEEITRTTVKASAEQVGSAAKGGTWNLDWFMPWLPEVVGSYPGVFDPDPEVVWAKVFGSRDYDAGEGISTDSAGNIYATGRFNRSIDLDGDGTNDLTSAGGNDAYIAKYSSDGTLTWAKNLGSSSLDWGYGISTDSDGNVYATGWFNRSIDLNGDGITDLTSTGGSDAYIAKYSSDGTLAWAKNLGGSGSDSGNDITTDSDGNVYSTGWFNESIDLDGDGTNDLTSAGGNDAYIAKYSSDGTLAWAKNLGSSGDDSGNDITTDSDGNVYATGWFNESIDLDGNGTTDLSSEGGDDAYIVKYTSDGSFNWATNVGSSGSELGNGINTDSLGNVYGTGSFQGSLDLNGDGTTDLSSEGDYDAYIVKYTSDGSLAWTTQVGSFITDHGYDISTDGYGNLYATGSFSGKIDLDGDGTTDLTSEGGSDAYIIKYSNSGTLAWATQIGSVGYIDYRGFGSNDRGYGISNDSDGNVYATGNSQGSIDFNGDGIADLTSPGSGDAFIIKLSGNGSTNQAPTITSSASVSIAENTTDVITVSATDADSDPLTYFITGGDDQSLFDIDSLSGAVTFTNAPDYETPADANGDNLYKLEVTVDDGNGGTDMEGLSITVTDEDETPPTPTPSTAPPIAWAKSIGGSNNEYGYGVTTDSSGNIFATGYYIGSLDIDGDGTNDLTGASTADSYIAKLNSDGTLAWATSVGGGGFQEGRGITTDSSDNIFATGTSGTDAYITKYTNDGNLAWTTNFGGDGSVTGQAISIDTSGNVFITGRLAGDIDLDGDGINDLSSAGGYDPYIAKFSSDGSFAWATNLGNNTSGSGSESGYGITTDFSGNVFATGYFTGSIDLNGDGTDDLISSGSQDAYVTKFNSNGSFEWAINLGISNRPDYGYDITTDSLGNVLVTGVFSGTIDLDGDGNDDLTSAGDNDAFIVKYNSDGTLAWSTNIGQSDGADKGYGITTDSSGNIFATGYFKGNVDIDGDGTDDLTAQGGGDVYVVKFQSDGTFDWATNVGGTGWDVGWDITTDSSGNVIITGQFEENIDLDGDGTDDLINAGNFDAFIIKLGENGVTNQAPSFTSSASVSIAENTTDVITVSATDADSDPLTYFITGGDDQSLFDIDSLSGAVTFTNAPDYETPGDANGDNIYNLEVTVDDGNGGTDAQTLSITVTDEDETPPTPSAAPQVVWSHYFGDSSNDYGTGLSSDSSGNIFATGNFHGSIDLDGDGTIDLTSAGGQDAYLAKYTSSGSLAWVTQIGSSGYDAGNGITTDSSGNLIATGFFSGNIDLDGNGTDDLTTLANNSNKQAYIAKYNNDGSLSWANQVRMPNGVEGIAVSTDNSGNVVATGTFTGNIDLNGDGTDDLASVGVAGVDDSYILKYNSDGSFAWANQIGGTSNDKGTAISTDSAGNVFATGNFQGDLDLDGDGTIDLTNAGGSDVYIAKYTSNGSLSWINQIGGTNFDQGSGITTDSAGNVIATGLFYQNLDLDGDGTNDLTDVGTYITKYSNDGSLIWATQMGNTHNLKSTGINTDSSGNIFVTGFFSVNVDLDGDGTDDLITSGGTDAYIAQYNSDGTFAWVETFGGSSHDRGFAINTDNSGNIYATGRFDGNVDLDGDGTDDWFNSGGQDSFIIKLGEATPNQAPTITSSTSTNTAENTTDVITVSATDADSDPLTYFITGGDDQSLFDIDSLSGAVTFTNAPDYETPADANGDNIYNLEVTVDDGNGGTDAQTLSITVTDEDEVAPNPAAIDSQDTSWTVAATADFNADNKDDVLWRNSSGDNQLWIMDGNTVSSTVDLSNSTLELVGANDFDGDNDADLLWRNTSTGANELWTMSDGSASSTDAIRSAATNWEVQGTEDFDGDGNADIFWRDPLTGQNSIWFMDGSTRVNSGNISHGATNWEVAALDDFNADGKTDILWNDPSNGANAIWLMDGLSVVSGKRINRAGAGWELQGTEDFNGDNKADLLWRNGSGSNAVWFIDDTTIASGQNLSGAIARWDVQGLGDFNNNGSPDIFWRDSATGDNALWLMDGTTHSGGAMLV